MKKRLLTGSIIVLVVTLFVVTRLFTPYAFDLFIGVLAVMGSLEVARVLERKRMFTSIPLIATFPALTYVAMSIGLHNNRPAVFYLLYFLVIIFVLSIFPPCLPGVPQGTGSPAGATPITPIIGLTGILKSSNTAMPNFSNLSVTSLFVLS